MQDEHPQNGSSSSLGSNAAEGVSQSAGAGENITDAETLPAVSTSDVSSDATLPAPSGSEPVLRPDDPATQETLPEGVASEGARQASGTITARDTDPPTDQDLTDVTPECPGRYTILWEAGRGGIGRVVLAEDRHTGRQIAIKELLAPQPSSMSEGSLTTATARFLREARITAQLEHPGIVPLYEIGRRPDGTFYYTMQFIRGKTLMDSITESPYVSDRLSLLPHFCSLCNAIAFAHSKGILHRDIKPGNVMLGEFGETLVIDWGLAKTAGGRDRANSPFARRAELLRDLAAGQTMIGQAVGTPAYMAPEQARGKHDDVDELSDVYALGAVLYQILTRQPPFTGKNAQEILLKVIGYAAGDLTMLTPTDLDPDVPPELSAVAMKALSAEKSERYASAKELVRDVEAFMTGKRVSAYRYSKLELATRFVRKHKAAAAASMAVAVAILAALVVTSLSYRKEWEARRRERRARILEHQQRLIAHWQLARAHLHKALTLAADHRMLEAGFFAAKGLMEDPKLPGSPYHDPGFRPPGTQDTEFMEPELASMVYLARTSALKGITKAISLREDPTAVALSSATGNILVSSNRGMEVHGLEPGHRTLRPPEGIVLALEPGGRAALLATAGRRLVLWRAASGRRTELPAPGAMVRTAAFLGQDRVALGLDDGSVEILDVTSNEKILHRNLFLDPVDCLAVCGPNIVAASSGRQFALFAPDHKPLEGGSTARTIPWAGVVHKQGGLLFEATLPAPVTALSMSPNCRWLAIGSEDGTILLRDMDGISIMHRLSAHRDRVTALRFSRKGDMLASGSWDGTLRLWSTTGHPIAAVSAHAQGVRALTFSPNADLIVTVGADRRALVWPVAQPSPIVAFESAVGQIKAACFSRNGRFLAAGGSERASAIWSRNAPSRPIAHLLGQAPVRAVAFSADAKAFFYAYGGTLISVLCPAGKLLRNLQAHKNVIRSIQTCPDGKLLLTAGMDGHLKGWDPARQRLLFDRDTGNRILRSALSPDCRQAATASLDGRVQLWSLTDWQAPPTLLFRHRHLASALAFSPDGTQVASAGQDGDIVVQDVSSGHVVARLTAHSRWVNQLAFSPDGKLLASGGDDRRVWIWNCETWHPMLFIPTQKEVLALAFSPTGKKLALGDAGRLLLYPMAISGLSSNPAATLDDLRRRLGRPPVQTPHQSR